MNDSVSSNETDALFFARFEEERDALEALEAAGLDPGERDQLALLRRIADKGLTEVLKRRPKSGDEVLLLVNAFLADGASAIIRIGSQRGGDFLTNQLRGRWAERVAVSLKLPSVVLRQFGPSGAAMPGEEDHRKIVTAFRHVTLVEGKRPDLIGFAAELWASFDEDVIESIESWPNRLLKGSDEILVRKAICGIEVKNSTWHFGQRRAAEGGPLSITVKDEELEGFVDWSRRTGLPLLFFQVLFDEIYCMSFKRMLEAKERGYMYRTGDHDADKGAGGKAYHRFHIDGPPHLCGLVKFPSESLAHVRVLDDGSVVPYIEFLPAWAELTAADVFFRELEWGVPY